MPGLEVDFAAQGEVFQKKAPKGESLIPSEKSNIDNQKYRTLEVAQRKAKNASVLNHQTAAGRD